MLNAALLKQLKRLHPSEPVELHDVIRAKLGGDLPPVSERSLSSASPRSRQTRRTSSPAMSGRRTVRNGARYPVPVCVTSDSACVECATLKVSSPAFVAKILPHYRPGRGEQSCYSLFKCHDNPSPDLFSHHAGSCRTPQAEASPWIWCIGYLIILRSRGYAMRARRSGSGISPVTDCPRMSSSRRKNLYR